MVNLYFGIIKLYLADEFVFILSKIDEIFKIDLFLEGVRLNSYPRNKIINFASFLAKFVVCAFFYVENNSFRAHGCIVILNTELLGITWTNYRVTLPGLEYLFNFF